MTEPRWDSEKRKAIIRDDQRGPDSLECSPDTAYGHDLCLLDYRDLGPVGFECGCGCHDLDDINEQVRGGE